MSFLLSLVVVFAAAGQVERPMNFTKEAAVARAKQALAEHARVPARDVEEREVTAAEWPDASLGCPQPDAFYAQVVTPGYRVLLALKERLFEVHVSAGRAVVCGKPLSVAPGVAPTPEEAGQPVPPGQTPIPDPTEPGSKHLVEQAKTDLAKRLSVPLDAIALLEFRQVVWPDRGLGCARPGVEYTQVPVDGVLMRLAAAGRAYEYHAGGGQAPFLCERPRPKR